MTATQEAQKRLAEYDARHNGLVRARNAAQAQMATSIEEAERLTVLKELGEATDGQIDARWAEADEARARLTETEAELATAKQARAVLEARLEAAKEEDAAAARRARLVEYRDAATELLGLLGRVKEQHDRMEKAGVGFWRNGYVGLGKASRAAVESWPEKVARDVKLANQRLGEGGRDDGRS